MLNLLKKFFPGNEEHKEAIDIQRIIKQVKEREQKQDVPLGRRIHSFSYMDLQLYLDRDITENYRVTVYRGQDRIYSFTIFVKGGDYDILEKACSNIITFLDGEQNIGSLPDDEIIKGFFYGH